MAERTRATIVSGFLGAGKTSLIRQLLLQSDAGCSVLVNEIGTVGLDGAAIEAVSGASCQVRELVGGCICCTAQLPFRQALVELLRRRPRHLIVEPTGVASLHGVHQVLSDPGIAPYIACAPVLTVVDPRHWDDVQMQQHPVFAEQIAAADVLVMSHCDRCSPELLERFRLAHAGRTLLTAEHGTIVEGWDQITAAPFAAATTEHATVGKIHPMTWTWPTDDPFSADHLATTWQRFWQDHPPPACLLRCKGVFHTVSGWQSVQAEHGGVEIRTTSADVCSKLVLIFRTDPDSDSWAQTLRRTLDRVPRVSSTAAALAYPSASTSLPG